MTPPQELWLRHVVTRVCRARRTCALGAGGRYQQTQSSQGREGHPSRTGSGSQRRGGDALLRPWCRLRAWRLLLVAARDPGGDSWSAQSQTWQPPCARARRCASPLPWHSWCVLPCVARAASRLPWRWRSLCVLSRAFSTLCCCPPLTRCALLLCFPHAGHTSLPAPHHSLCCEVSGQQQTRGGTGACVRQAAHARHVGGCAAWRHRRAASTLASDA